MYQNVVNWGTILKARYMLLAFQAHLIMWVILLELTIWTAFMINFKFKLWQDDHIFEKLNSLSSPGYFKLFPWATLERKTRWVHFCRRSCHIFFIFPEFSRFFPQSSNFPEFSLSFPWYFHNFSNSLSFPGFPGLWPPCMRRIAPGWTAHRMNICSSPNQQHEYSYLRLCSHCTG